MSYQLINISIYSMENHRLKPMKENYNEALFNKLYKETQNLRKSLVYSIDSRRFGVTPDIILSWFDDKFILVYNKYCDQYEPEVLKGHIINSLRTFKNRILRKAYNNEGEFFQSCVSTDTEFDVLNTIIEDEDDTVTEDYQEELKNYLSNTLSDNAFILAEILLSPPPYILSRIPETNSRISNQLILEYFELEDTERNDRKIKNLKKEINQALKNAKEVGI